MSDDAVFIPVGALAEGFAEQSYTLAGQPPRQRELTLCCRDGQQIVCQFYPDGTLSWDGQQRVACRQTSIREGIEFIDFIDNRYSASAVTLVCDHLQGCFTLVSGQLPTQNEAQLCALHRIKLGLSLTGVQVNVRFGWLQRAGEPGGLHDFSTELVGMRNLYHYSPSECYEHIYLNPHSYTWHCLQGVEKGLADVDRCQTVKIAERLYLFIWQEKVVPTLGVVLIDLRHGCTDGKIFGYQGDDFKALSNFAMGAKLEVLNILHRQL